MLRKLMYLFLIIFFLLASFAAYTAIVAVNKADNLIAQPLGNLVKELIVPATPVILPSSSTIVNQINDLTRLETASVELEKVVTAESGNNNFLWGMMGETMIFIAHGKVIAGVDFSEMNKEDMQVVDPDTVMLRLPPAKIFDDLPALDNDKSYVADRDTGFLVSADPQLESQVRQEAESVLREEAYATGLLDLANYNAQQYMLNFLQGLGFEQVIFTDDVPPTPVPYEQEVPKGYVLVTVTPSP